MADEFDDLGECSPTAWHKELESLLTGRCSKEEVLNVCKSRPLPSYLRNFVWQHCLELQEMRDPFIHFDGVCNRPEQTLIKKDSAALIDKIRQLQAEEDLLDDLDDVTSKYLRLQDDIEAVLTLYCKRHQVTYTPQADWMDILAPLLLCDFLRGDLYHVFESLVDLYVVKQPCSNKSPFLFVRLLLLYHDPHLCTFLDSTKIFPELYASKWFSSLFSHHSSLSTTLRIWDVYLQQKNQFLLFFLALVILVNARDEIMAMDKNDKQAITDKIASFPRELQPDDVEDFCSLAIYYLSKTPSSFGKMYQSLLFETDPSQPKQQQQQQQSPQHIHQQQQTTHQLQNTPQQQQHLELQQQQQQLLLQQQLAGLLCLHTSHEELIESIQSCSDNKQPSTSRETLAMLVVDCRSAEHYKRGHLTSSQHLNSHLMLQNPEEFASRVQALLSVQRSELMSQEEAVAASPSDNNNNNNVTCLGGEHLCFLGYGNNDDGEADDDETNDGALNMVVSHFLHKQVQYVCLCLGGYKALHDSLIASNNTHLLVGHNSKTCHYCNKPTKQLSSRKNNKTTLQSLNLQLNEAMFSERFGRLTSVFKATSGVIKDKVIGIIKNEGITSTRHVSAGDKLGKGYRNMASVFTIDDDEDDTTHSLTSEDDVKEVVLIADWLAQYAHADSVYECLEVASHSNHPNHKPSLLCLNDNHLIVLQRLPDDKTRAILRAKRPLSSILKITSKKKQPELITIMYGAASRLLSPAAASPHHPNEASLGQDSVAATAAADATLVGEDLATADEASSKEATGGNVEGDDDGAKDGVSDDKVDTRVEGSKEGGSEKMDANQEDDHKQQANSSSSSFDNTSITAIDRFLIPKAGEAIKDIKMHIIKLMEMLE